MEWKTLYWESGNLGFLTVDSFGNLLKTQNAFFWSRDVTQWYSAFLTCVRLWVQSPGPQEIKGRGFMYNVWIGKDSEIIPKLLS